MFYVIDYSIRFTFKLHRKIVTYVIDFRYMKTTTTAFLLTLLLCTGAFAQKEFQKKFQNQFIEAPDGSTIELPAGTFTLDASLSLDTKRDIVIKGAGEDKTILNFKGQISGAEGIKITNSYNITLQDLTVQ